MKSLGAIMMMLAMTALLAAAAAPPGSGVPAGVHYIGHDKVTATMAKGGPIVSDPGLVVLANRREAGEVDYHDTPTTFSLWSREKRPWRQVGP